MLSDPLNLISTSTSAVTPSGGGLALATIDPGSSPGKTVRQYGGYTFTILHSLTKENKPFGTKRVSLRLDQLINSTDMDPQTASAVGGAQLTLIQPIGSQVGTIITLAQYLGRTCLFGDYVASARSESNGVTFLTRLLTGEG